MELLFVISKNITLNIWSKNSEKIPVIQGEVNSRCLNIKLMDQATPLSLTDKTVNFLAKKTDDTVIFNSAEIVNTDNGIIKVYLTSQMWAVVRTLYDCAIHIISNDWSTLIVKSIDIEIVYSIGESVMWSISKYTAYEEIVGPLNTHKANSSNPHNATSAQVNALPDTTKYGSSLSINETSLSLKDKDGTILSSVTTQDTTYTGGPNVTNSSSNVISDIDTTYSLAAATTDSLMSSNIKLNLMELKMVLKLMYKATRIKLVRTLTTILKILSDLPSTLPIEKGGTGGKTVSEAQSALKIYTNITQLGLEYPLYYRRHCICYAVSIHWIFNVESSASTVTDVAAGFSFYKYINPQALEWEFY